jgi:hypothetical protein
LHREKRGSNGRTAAISPEHQPGEPGNVTWRFLVAVVGAESSHPTLIFHAKEAAHNRSPENSFVYAKTIM